MRCEGLKQPTQFFDQAVDLLGGVSGEDGDTQSAASGGAGVAANERDGDGLAKIVLHADDRG